MNLRSGDGEGDQLVKNLLAMQENPVRFLGWEDPLEKGKATHSNILAWKIPLTVLSMGSQRVGHDGEIFTFSPQTPLPSRLSHNIEQGSPCYIQLVLVGYPF